MQTVVETGIELLVPVILWFGYKFDGKNKVLDKASQLHRLAESLWLKLVSDLSRDIGDYKVERKARVKIIESDKQKSFVKTSNKRVLSVEHTKC